MLVNHPLIRFSHKYIEKTTKINRNIKRKGYNGM